MMKVVFVSFFDSKNLGDLLIAEVLEEKLMMNHSVSKYSFNLLPSKYINNQNKINNPNKGNKVKLQLKKLYLNYFRKLDIIDRIHLLRMKKKIDQNKYLKRFEEEVQHCDLLVLGGGNAIFDLTKHSLSAYKIRKIISIAKKYNKKIFITSIGIGPFVTQKQINYTIDTLKDADYITVRDKKSFDYIKSIGKKVYLSIDPVFLLKNSSKGAMNKQTKEKIISVCIIDLMLNKETNSTYKKYIMNLKHLINKLKQIDYKIILFSTEPKDYRAVNDVYIEFEDEENVIKKDILNYNDLSDLYKVTDLVIGTRMHSMIIALSQLIPVIGLSWQDKVKEMFKMIGKENDVFDVNNLDKNISNIEKLVEKKLKNNELVDLKNIKDQNTKKFEINFSLFKELSVPEQIKDISKG